MADFRVAEHHRWREAAVRAPGGANTRPETLEAPLVFDSEPLPAAAPNAWSRALGAPGRVHDVLFRPLKGHRALFLSARFLLVLVAVLLIMQGVVGSADVRTEPGEYRSVTNPATVQTYLAPGSTHKYPIDVGPGNDGRLSALFTNERGVVRLPSMAAGGPVYGLEIGVTKSHAGMDVRLLVAPPGESYRSVPILREEGHRVVFDAGQLHNAGEYGLLVRSTQGVGPAKMSITIVEAPVETVAGQGLAWFPLLSGAALATVLMGPYLPGVSGPVRSRAPGSTGSGTASAVVFVGPAVGPAGGAGFARITLANGLHMERQHGASAEELAARPGRGWVLRDE